MTCLTRYSYFCTGLPMRSKTCLSGPVVVDIVINEIRCMIIIKIIMIIFNMHLSKNNEI